MLHSLSKVFILGVSLGYALFKMQASATDFCYKCNGYCTKPPEIEMCDQSINKNPLCIAERDPIEKTETRSCYYPKAANVKNILCNNADDALCRICEGNFCNVPPFNRKRTGPSKCYYCNGICENPRKTSDCYYSDSACITIFYHLDYVDGKRDNFIHRDCYQIAVNKPKEICEQFSKSSEEGVKIDNCTLCSSSMCNRLPFDPPEPVYTEPPQLTALATTFEFNKKLLRCTIFIIFLRIKYIIF